MYVRNLVNINTLHEKLFTFVVLNYSEDSLNLSTIGYTNSANYLPKLVMLMPNCCCIADVPEDSCSRTTDIVRIMITLDSFDCSQKFAGMLPLSNSCEFHCITSLHRLLIIVPVVEEFVQIVA